MWEKKNTQQAEVLAKVAVKRLLGNTSLRISLQIIWLRLFLSMSRSTARVGGTAEASTPPGDQPGLLQIISVSAAHSRSLTHVVVNIGVGIGDLYPPR